jgi:steroid 5-alpha reductase family enzyme
LSGGYAPEWLLDARFISGFVLFGVGFIVNRHADKALINLRSGRENGYYLPSGGLFNYVSCPNYLGEIMIWAGWALSTWSLAGLAFLVWTVANLAPRALAHHKWYFNRFPDYPTNRKVLLPFIW